MKWIVLILVLGLRLTGNGEDWHQKWDASGSTWREKWANSLNLLESFSARERMEILGAAVRAGASNQGKQIDIFERARIQLLATSGHAEFYRDRIFDARRRFEAVGKAGDAGSVNERGARKADYLNAQSEAFKTLVLLPSVETVRVMGEFLADDVDRPPPPGEGEDVASFVMADLNCDRAARALAILIDNPTVRPGNYNFGTDLPRWSLWYEQVKAGKQTFRFVGDSTEYDLNGPAPKETLERIARDQKRDAERVAGHTKTVKSSGVPESPAAAVSSKSIPTAILIAAMVLLVSLVWYFMGRRKSGS